jgi:general secretion pathway protein J
LSAGRLLVKPNSPSLQRPVTGFTLIEIVVAIGIFAVIAAIAYPGLTQFLNIRDAIMERSEQISSIQRAVLFLENDLRYALNRSVRNEYGDFEEAWDTEAQSDELFRITAAYPDLALGGSAIPRRVAWAWDGNNLMRREWRVMDRTVDSEPSERIILSDIEDVEIRYAEIDIEGEDALTWSSRFDNQEQSVPPAIEVNISINSDIEFRRIFEIPVGGRESSGEGQGGGGGQGGQGGQGGDGDDGGQNAN